MRTQAELEARVREILGHEVIQMTDSGTLHLITERFVQKAQFVDLLDNSYSPMDRFVEDLHAGLEHDVEGLGQTLLTRPKPDDVRKIFESRSLDAEKYTILRNVIERLLSKEAHDYYTRFDLQPSRVAHDLIASFSIVRKVVTDGQVDIGVAIGPEGFWYASMFGLLGLPLRHIHIDEYCPTEDRPYRELDDLSIIAGKHVLFIEDDVRTGRTLEKAHQNIRRYSPSNVSLYLGNPEKRQNLQGIPRYFKKVYTVPNHLSDEQMRIEIDALIGILGKKYRIFKTF